MKLFIFELKKYIFKPSILICLVIFALINFVKVFEYYYYFNNGRFAIGNDAALYSAKSELYNIYKGLINDEKIQNLQLDLTKAQQLLKEYGTGIRVEESLSGYPYGDINLINELISDYEYAILYTNKANDTAAAAMNNIYFFQNRSDFEIRKNTYIYNVFRDRSVNVYVKENGWTNLFEFKFSSVLSMLMITLAVSPVFSGEKGVGFDRLIIAAGQRKSSIQYKILSAFSFTFIVSLLFMLLDMVYISAIYGLDGFTAMIYTLPTFENAPFNIRLSSALLISFAGRLAAMCFYTSVVLLISSLCGNSGISLATSAAIGTVCVLLTEHLPSFLNPLSLVSMTEYFIKFEFVNIFGFPVLTLVISFLFTILLTITITLLAWRRAFR